MNFFLNHEQLFSSKQESKNDTIALIYQYLSKSFNVLKVERLALTILIEPFNNKYFAYQIPIL